MPFYLIISLLAGINSAILLLRFTRDWNISILACALARLYLAFVAVWLSFGGQPANVQLYMILGGALAVMVGELINHVSRWLIYRIKDSGNNTNTAKLPKPGRG